MKAEIKIVALVVAGIVGMGANLALAVPVANQQADYTGMLARVRGNRQVNWVVVDSDSQGLNCFVRANTRFIKPIRENPTTLKPLE
jgi:hypothetical protein